MTGQGETSEQRQENELKVTREAFAEFAAAAVHDLRSPVNHVRSFVAMLLEDLAASADPEIVQHLNAATARMQSVLEGLTAYANAVTQKYQFEDVDTGGLVKTAASRLLAVETGELVVVQAGLPVVRGDPKQLLKVFLQLMDNAAKFRSAEVPRVEFTADKENTEWVFSARDNGIGIDPARQHLIFKPFRRLWGEKYPGTGIGLAVAERIIQLHGGRIWVGSAPPAGGCCLHFTIPAR